MNLVALLIGLGPLIGWGLFPTIASKFGGKPVNQIIGATVGTLILPLYSLSPQAIASQQVWICSLHYYQELVGVSVKL